MLSQKKKNLKHKDNFIIHIKESQENRKKKRESDALLISEYEITKHDRSHSTYTGAYN